MRVAPSVWARFVRFPRKLVKRPGISMQALGRMAAPDKRSNVSFGRVI
jgi:hypothetical protein